MRKILIIPLILILLGCNLYIAEKEDITYKEFIDYGLNKVDNMPVKVTIVKNKFTALEEEHIDLSRWTSVETIEHDNRLIFSYIAINEKSVLLVPSN